MLGDRLNGIMNLFGRCNIIKLSKACRVMLDCIGSGFSFFVNFLEIDNGDDLTSGF